MALPPRGTRPLPRSPADRSDEGVRTGLVTRILIVGTIVLGQLWALTAALELRLTGEKGKPWLLAVFSIGSFVVVLVLVHLDPPRWPYLLRKVLRSIGSPVFRIHCGHPERRHRRQPDVRSSPSHMRKPTVGREGFLRE